MQDCCGRGCSSVSRASHPRIAGKMPATRTVPTLCCASGCRNSFTDTPMVSVQVFWHAAASYLMGQGLDRSRVRRGAAEVYRWEATRRGRAAHPLQRAFCSRTMPAAPLRVGAGGPNAANSSRRAADSQSVRPSFPRRGRRQMPERSVAPTTPSAAGMRCGFQPLRRRSVPARLSGSRAFLPVTQDPWTFALVP